MQCLLHLKEISSIFAHLNVEYWYINLLSILSQKRSNYTQLDFPPFISFECESHLFTNKPKMVMISSLLIDYQYKIQ